MKFQDIILTLNQFWGEQGCIIAQPYDVEKGAGTMNPATFLRALGPEPWNVAYVEPSRRPTDGRYGENLIGYSIIFNTKSFLSPLRTMFRSYIYRVWSVWELILVSMIFGL